MSSAPSLRPPYTFTGWIIQEINLNSEIAMIRLRRHKQKQILCPNCNCRAGENRRIWQSAKDLPLGSVRLVQIFYEAIQGRCSNCNSYFTVIPDGINQNAKATKRLMNYVCRLCRFMPVNKVPFFLPISASTARRWDKWILSECLPDPDLDNLRVVLVDEKMKFAKGLNQDRNEILSFIQHRITSAKLGAFNATISRIIKRACGYRDLDYLYLKIRQESTLPALQT